MNDSTTVTGDLVTLRPPAESDIEFLGVLRNDVQLQARLIAIARGSTAEQVREWVERRSSDPQGCFFVIAESATGRGVGYLQLTGIDPDHGFAELGFCIDPREHRKGYGREAHRLLERFALNQLGLRKIFLRVLGSNEAAIAFYESLGYRHAGRLERHALIEGDYRDVILMEKFLNADV